MRACASELVPDRGPDSARRLFDLVRREALPESRGNGLRAADVLAELGAADLLDLYPAPPQLLDVRDPLPAPGARAVAEAALAHLGGVVVAHGQAGAGKTTAMLQVADHLPAGSVVVLFDCYGGGEYLSSGGERHTPQRFVTQTVNDLAQRCGTPLLVQPPQIEGDLWRLLARTLSRAVGTLNPGAVLVVVVDAADNAAVAATERGDRGFLPGLVGLRLPPRVAVVLTARSHRVESLGAGTASRVEVVPFDRETSAAHLRRHRPAASDADATEFHTRTGGNPRAQFYVLEQADKADWDMPTLMEACARTPETLFDDIVNSALQVSGADAGGQRWRALMVALTRPVSTAAFAAALGVDLVAVDAFVAGLAPGVNVVDGAIQFRDEDFETYVRDRVDPADAGRLTESAPRGREFRTIEQWDPLQLGVHEAIVIGDPQTASLSVLTPYVLRRHDEVLRQALRVPLRHRMIVLTGLPCTGKTRTALEAVRAELPRWPIVRPFTGDALLRDFEKSYLAGPRVLWLNELQRYLDPPGGNAVAGALAAVLAGPDGIVVVATMPSGAWNTLTRRRDDEDTSPHAAARELLVAARRISIPPSFEGEKQALDRLRSLIRTDPRLAFAAQAAADDGRIVQALTGGPELLRRFHESDDALGSAVIIAAIDARRLGCHAPVPAAFLRDAALAYLDPEQRANRRADDWFDTALSTVCEPVYGIRALTGNREEDGFGEADHYQPHEFLVQHLGAELRTARTPATAWQALLDHVHGPGDRLAIGECAASRGLLRIAASALRPLAHAGDIQAIELLLHKVIRAHPDRTRWVHHGALVGSSDCMWEMAREAEKRGDAEQEAFWLRRFIEATAGLSMPDIIGRLDELDLLADAVTCLTPAAEAGNETAVNALVTVHRRSRNYQAAIDLQLSAATAGDAHAAFNVAMLYRDAGKSDQHRTWLETAAEHGFTIALYDLADLCREAGDLNGAQSWTRRAAAQGSKRAIRSLADPLVEQGRFGEAAELWRVRNSSRAADLFTQGGDTDRAAAIWAPLAEAGDATAMHMLGETLQLAGDNPAAEFWLRRSADIGHPEGRRKLAKFWADAGRPNEALSVWQAQANAGDSHAAAHYTDVLVKLGQAEQARTWLTARAESGDGSCMELLAAHLEADGDKIAALAWDKRAAHAGQARTARRLARDYEAADNVEAAIEILRAVADDDYRSARAFDSLLYKNRSWDELEARLREQMEQNCWPCVDKPTLADVLRQRGQAAEAEDFERYGIEPGGATASDWSMALPLRCSCTSPTQPQEDT